MHDVNRPRVDIYKPLVDVACRVSEFLRCVLDVRVLVSESIELNLARKMSFRWPYHGKNQQSSTTASYQMDYSRTIVMATCIT